MKASHVRYAVLAMIILWSGSLFSQYKFFDPKESFAIEASLPNSDLTRLPMYRNSMTSLAVVGDYIVGGTTAKEGLAPFVFTASLKQKTMLELQDMDRVIKGQRSIRSGFCRGKGGLLFAGTMPNKKADGSEGDGHLIEVKIGQNGSIAIQDLGVPLPGEGVFSLAGNAAGSTLYGISFPSGKFFKYDIGTKQTKVFDDITPTKKQKKILEAEYALAPEEYLGKSLIQDDKGVIYGSMPINKLFSYDPKKETFRIWETELPEVWGRRTLGQVESWAKAKNGTLYGGNAGDGQLFALNPISQKITNLGKPIMMNRLRGLVFGQDGKLYGIAGALPGYAHLFSYDADAEGYRDLGNPEFTMKAPGIEQGIQWRGFQIGTIAASEDGKYIVMGEDEALSHLLVFAVGEVGEGRIGD